MTSIAVDIAILVPERIADLAIEFNKELLKHNEPLIVLDKKDCLPHLTLCQLSLESTKLAQAAQALQLLGQAHAPFQIILTRTDTTLFGGKLLAGFEIAPNAQLRSLHEEAMRAFDPFASGAEPHFFEEVTLALRESVRAYARLHAFKLHHPHITLGCGQPKPLGSPHPFTVSRIAICQLGNWGTCRKILYETSLRGN